MPTRTLRTPTITLGRWKYELEFLSSYEVRLKLTNPNITPFDSFGEDGDGYSRTFHGEKVITLTRWVIREIKAYLKANKPPYIYYTIGFDFTRYSLYHRIAGKFEPLGYGLAHAPNTGEFYCYRIASPS
jgi:hypothetical protein